MGTYGKLVDGVDAFTLRIVGYVGGNFSSCLRVVDHKPLVEDRHQQQCDWRPVTAAQRECENFSDGVLFSVRSAVPSFQSCTLRFW
jgi:hypothetical protein